MGRSGPWGPGCRPGGPRTRRVGALPGPGAGRPRRAGRRAERGGRRAEGGGRSTLTPEPTAAVVQSTLRTRLARPAVACAPSPPFVRSDPAPVRSPRLRLPAPPPAPGLRAPAAGLLSGAGLHRPCAGRPRGPRPRIPGPRPRAGPRSHAPEESRRRPRGRRTVGPPGTTDAVQAYAGRTGAGRRDLARRNVVRPLNPGRTARSQGS